MSIIFMRPATKKDIDQILEIIKNAKSFLASKNIDQWQINYPNDDVVTKDIMDKVGYVLQVDGNVAGYAVINYGHDNNYANIYNGEWSNNNNEYVTIHRFAISDKYRGQGLSQKFMSQIFSHVYLLGHSDIRIDTHEKNELMQKVILGNGFQKRGSVTINEDGNEVHRFAYQINL